MDLFDFKIINEEEYNKLDKNTSLYNIISTSLERQKEEKLRSIEKQNEPKKKKK